MAEEKRKGEWVKVCGGGVENMKGEINAFNRNKLFRFEKY